MKMIKAVYEIIIMGLGVVLYLVDGMLFRVISECRALQHL